ncbi:unnamed protein product [Effrenium voratum]|uniref:Uncharacterized protein n=2 Tax=Effrenium voratum TaxID=2562239 RepID=A0AA36N7E5_9DINO|nr:unnamed protein product [Effrenium voratum]
MSLLPPCGRPESPSARPGCAEGRRSSSTRRHRAGLGQQQQAPDGSTDTACRSRTASKAADSASGGSGLIGTPSVRHRRAGCPCPKAEATPSLQEDTHRHMHIFAVCDACAARTCPGTLPSTYAALMAPRAWRPSHGPVRQLKELRVALPRVRPHGGQPATAVDYNMHRFRRLWGILAGEGADGVVLHARLRSALVRQTGRRVKGLLAAPSRQLVVMLRGPPVHGADGARAVKDMPRADWQRHGAQCTETVREEGLKADTAVIKLCGVTAAGWEGAAAPSNKASSFPCARRAVGVALRRRDIVRAHQHTRRAIVHDAARALGLGVAKSRNTTLGPGLEAQAVRKLAFREAAEAAAAKVGGAGAPKGDGRAAAEPLVAAKGEGSAEPGNAPVKGDGAAAGAPPGPKKGEVATGTCAGVGGAEVAEAADGGGKAENTVRGRPTARLSAGLPRPDRASCARAPAPARRKRSAARRPVAPANRTERWRKERAKHPHPLHAEVATRGWHGSANDVVDGVPRLPKPALGPAGRMGIRVVRTAAAATWRLARWTKPAPHLRCCPTLRPAVTVLPYGLRSVLPVLRHGSHEALSALALARLTALQKPGRGCRQSVAHALLVCAGGSPVHFSDGFGPLSLAWGWAVLALATGTLLGLPRASFGRRAPQLLAATGPDAHGSRGRVARCPSSGLTPVQPPRPTAARVCGRSLRSRRAACSLGRGGGQPAGL